MQKIREKLEKLYNYFDFEKAVQNDPIKFPKRFTDPLDIEVSAIIASFFAYGSIKCFCNFLEELFRIMGRNPSDFILTFKPLKLIEKLNIKYRFSSIHDIVAFLFILKNMLENSPSNSLEDYFQCHSEQSEESPSLISRIFNFTQSAIKTDLTPIYGKNIKPQGLLHFFPNPLKGSPCKRINLFLRWMVRNKDIDFGLWNTIKPKELIIPLDIHIWRVSKKLGFTRKNTQSIKTAIEITEYLRKIEPEDPLKYDFVLCHGDINSLI
ncbi:MAG: TIGR02757 family protein [Thermodesulfovibrio sp.]|nr:TIGR02757 family protein [Thermodesulfovibrio sp.]MDW7972223.1 TIGR02757 family protein [Thermodesulfovibrio sp.]